MSDEQKLKCIFGMYTQEFYDEIEKHQPKKIQGKILQFPMPINKEEIDNDEHSLTISPALILEIEYAVKKQMTN